MSRRIFGIETEYGLTFAADGEKTLTPDELARHLFRKVVEWGRSSNVFLGNGSRLYLDVGSHPEYATAECDGVAQLIAHDRAGERILESLALDAQHRLAEQGIPGRVHLFKNNTDSAGNSYGCHENYLLRRQGDFTRVTEILVPHLITRQILVGAGKVLPVGKRSIYTFSQRADHIWETISSATTRSRPIINTRDEPHADAEHYRRLHVIVGDSSMAEPTTMLKVGATDLVLRMIEAGIPVRDLSLENPMRAIREISHDLSGQAPVTLANGRTTTAIDIQREYLARAVQFLDANGYAQPHDRDTIDLWQRGLDAVESGDFSAVSSELDWAIKLGVIRRYQERSGAELDDPRIARIDLAYHDIATDRGLYYKLARSGAVRTIVSEADIDEAQNLPPQTTRAKLRGDFVRAALGAGQDYTVDWVHLKLNDHAQRTVLCKDPFAAADTRVDRLLESMITL